MVYLLLLFITVIASISMGKPILNILKLLNAKQTIREDGPAHHITNKTKTPTMGGIIFLLPIFLINLIGLYTIQSFRSKELITVLLVTFILAILGFSDDFQKVLKKTNKGVSGWIKLFIQFIIALALFLIYKEENNLLYLAWLFFIIAGASNSYNLTDGLDGLLGSISIVSFLGFTVLLASIGKTELVIFSITFIGALIGFLYYNWHPAKVFMGDTGSLAIGGALGAMAIVTKHELFLIPFAIIPIIETLSVILQVLSFKLSKKFLGKDKRIFKMAPLHHHFELCGWSELCIVKRFTIFQLIFTLSGMFLIYSMTR